MLHYRIISELTSTLANAQWHLAILAFFTLLPGPPKAALDRAGDVIALALFGPQRALLPASDRFGSCGTIAVRLRFKEPLSVRSPL